MSDTTQQVIYIKVTDALPVNRGVYTTNKGELRAVFGDNEFLYWTDLKHKKHIHSKKGVEWYLQPIDANSVKQEAAAKAWINVKERLPKRNDIVLFGTEDTEECNVGFYIMDGYWHNIHTKMTHGGVSHWQPLPMPPKIS